jgi:hypothetical protein
MCTATECWILNTVEDNSAGCKQNPRVDSSHELKVPYRKPCTFLASCTCGDTVREIFNPIR